MYRKIFALFTIITLVVTATVTAQQSHQLKPKKHDHDYFKELDRQLDKMVKANEFSGAVLIAKNGQAIFRKAYGLASREFDVPNNEKTKFNIGSICKVFTQIAIGQLVLQNKLTLDDTIGQHLQDYPNQQARDLVKIKHLLEMSSGIGDIFNDKYRSIAKDRLQTIADHLPLFADEPLAFEPGTRRQYSNGGYLVLGAIIEKVTGRSYFEYVRDNIFNPTEMKDTQFYLADDILTNLANGYTPINLRAEDKSQLKNNIYTRPARGSSAGGGYSTIDDLLKFVSALQSGQLILPEMLGPPGGGLRIGGGGPGINAMINTNVRGEYTVIVLSNLDPPSAEVVADLIRSGI